jgi:hypothetical protein
MGFGKWLRRKIDESDEKQIRNSKERKYFENLGNIEREKQITKLEGINKFKRIELEKQERMIDPFGFEGSGRASGHHWKRIMGIKPYGTKRKKRRW